MGQKRILIQIKRLCVRTDPVNVMNLWYMQTERPPQMKKKSNYNFFPPYLDIICADAVIRVHHAIR